MKVGALVRYRPEDVEVWLGKLATGASDSLRSANGAPRLMTKIR